MMNSPSEYTDWPENPQSEFEAFREIRDTQLVRDPTYVMSAMDFAADTMSAVGRQTAQRTYLFHLLTGSSGVRPEMCDQFDFDGAYSVQAFMQKWQRKIAAQYSPA